MDITGIMLATVSFMFILSGPRGRNKYWPLGFGLLLAALGILYGYVNHEAIYYGVAAAVVAKALWMFRRWES